MSTTSQLSENSHQGFEGIKAALYLGSTGVKSNTASGLQFRLRQNGIGSRSSGKERDAETGLDFFLARYYSGAQGRFMSSDPLYIDLRRLGDPQQLNNYAYVRNNPLKFIDPTGLYLTCEGSKELCEQYGSQLQSSLSFKINVDPSGTNKWQINVDPSFFTSGVKLPEEQDLILQIIMSSTKHVHIKMVNINEQYGMFFGSSELWNGGRRGWHTINAVQAALFGNAGGYSFKQLVAHETLEAALEVLRRLKYEDAHSQTIQYSGFEGLEPAPGLMSLPDVITGTNKASGVTTFWRATGKDKTMEIYLKFKNPVPEESIRRAKQYPSSVKTW
jgi:RHS repeat-associated protein